MIMSLVRRSSTGSSMSRRSSFGDHEELGSRKALRKRSSSTRSVMGKLYILECKSIVIDVIVALTHKQAITIIVSRPIS